MKRSVLSTILTLLFVLSTACDHACAIDANALPGIVGSVNVENSVNNSTNTLTSKVTGGNGAVGQNDMVGGLGSNANWDIQATGHSQTFLGRFLDGKLTELNGRITTSCAASGCSYGDTMKVILVNPYGITFGNGSTVNANSFTVSTFDAVGAKNIKNMSAAELEAYKASLASKFGPNVDIKFEGGSSTNGAAVTLNGSTWNIDKTAAIVAKDINIYKGSKISTNLNYNYGTPANKNFSNLKLVTSDGVTFKYAANGYMNNNDVKVANAKSGVDYNINIGDAKSSNSVDATLSSGSIDIINKGTTNNSAVNLNKAAVKGYKLINNAYGDIYLVGNEVNINDSNIETFNTHEVSTPSNNTYDKTGGSITVEANKGLNVKNSNIASAYSTTKDGAGDINLSTKSGNLTITNGSIINSKGAVNAVADNGKVIVDDAVLSARNEAKSGQVEDLLVSGSKGVDITDTYVDASNNVTIKSSNGDINLVKNGKVNADKKLTIVGKNTLIEDSTVSYNSIALHDGKNDNNVTVKGKTTLKDTGSNKGLVLDVKGNLTIDNSSLKSNTAGQDYSKAVDQDNITLTATGDITTKNNSNIKSKSDIKMTANKNVYVENSSLTAVNNTLTATTGKISLNKAKVDATSKNTLKANTDVDVECSDVKGENNDITATNGAIAVKNSALTAKSNNNLNAKTNVKTSNARVKGGNNTIKAQTGNIEVVNTEIAADKTNTIVANKGNVTFKFDKNLQKTCTGNGCIEVVEGNTVKGNDNVIRADEGDVTVSDVAITAENSNSITSPKGSVRLEKVKVTAKKDNTITAYENVDTECAELEAENNIITAQTGNVTMSNTEAKATNDNTITANNNVKTANVRIKGNNNKVTSKVGNIDVVNTEIVADKTNSIVANKGKISFKFDKELKEVCTGNGCLDAVEENVVKGTDNNIKANEGDIEIKDAKITAENDNNITSPKGSVRLEKVKVTAKKDNNIVAADDVDTECAELEAENNIITAQNGNITMSNTEAKATKDNKITANKNIKTSNVRITANNNNELNAKTGNIDIVNTEFVAKAKNSIKADKGNVTFKFDKELKEVCTGNGCLDAVEDTSIQGPKNDVVAGGDIVADVTIKPVDPKKPEDTVTTFKGENVTTGAKVVYDDLYDQVGTIVGEGELDANGTKVKIESEGNVNLVLKNAGNKNAGLEASGKKVEIKTRDGKLSISKLYADELYLSKDEKFIAGKTTITDEEKAIDSFAPSNPDSVANQQGYEAELPGRAYIEVGSGFNFDYEPSQVAVGGMYQGSFNEIRDAEGNVIGYGKHFVTLDGDSTEGQFLLSYKKPFACEPEPDVEPDTSLPNTGYLTDQTAISRLPLQSDMIGQVGNIQNGITDPSSGMIAAAAAIDVEDDDE